MVVRIAKQSNPCLRKAPSGNQSAGKVWAQAGEHHTRTPLCVIEEEDGIFTVIYTAIMKVNNRNFYPLGKCTLGWK